MTVKDNETGNILTTNSIWLKKKWLKDPERFITNFKKKTKKTTQKVVEEEVLEKSDK